MYIQRNQNKHDSRFFFGKSVSNIFNVLKEKKCLLRTPYPANMPFKNKGKCTDYFRCTGAEKNLLSADLN